MATSSVVRTARENRKEMTPAETKLWMALRGRRVSGLKFRKQHPFDHYILDFFCAEQLLAIEVDGDIHNLPENKILDQERSEHLTAQGVRILRFSNDVVLNNLNKVLESILTFTRENLLS